METGAHRVRATVARWARRIGTATREEAERARRWDKTVY
jgi:hypothetical protein